MSSSRVIEGHSKKGLLQQNWNGRRISLEGTGMDALPGMSFLQEISFLLNLRIRIHLGLLLTRISFTPACVSSAPFEQMSAAAQLIVKSIVEG